MKCLQPTANKKTNNLDQFRHLARSTNYAHTQGRIEALEVDNVREAGHNTLRVSMTGDAPMTEERKINGTPAEAEGGVDVPSGKSLNKTAFVIALVVVFIGVLVAVFSATRDDNSSSPNSTVPATETTLPAAEQKVLADYRAFWDAYLEASNPMRPDHPALAQHSTGDEFRQVVESFSAMKAGNEIIKGTIDLSPKIAGVSADSATINDCVDDHTGIYDATSGERKDADDPRRRGSTVSLMLIDGTWKVSHLRSEGFGCTP